MKQKKVHYRNNVKVKSIMVWVKANKVLYKGISGTVMLKMVMTKVGKNWDYYNAKRDKKAPLMSER